MIVLKPHKHLTQQNRTFVESILPNVSVFSAVVRFLRELSTLAHDCQHHTDVVWQIDLGTVRP